MEISGKPVIVAGGSGNLGSAIVDALVERGAMVTVLDLRAAQGQPSVRFLECDLADESSVASALDAVTESSPKISALVSCAGLIHSEPLVNLMQPERRHSIEGWEAVMRSNLTASFVIGSHVAERMASTRSKGVIVNFSSIASAGNPGQTAYSAAKAGVEAMTRVWARELGAFGIRCVSIAPGFIDTPSTHAALSDAAVADIKRRTPLPRLGKPSEIASAVLFAIENDFLTGTTIAIDGALVL